MSQAGSEARERRRERAQQKKGRGESRRIWNRFKVHLVIVLLWLAIVGVVWAATPDEHKCPGHWHSTMDVYVDGQAVSFDHPSFTIEQNPDMPFSTHMHRGSPGLWHFEPQGGRDCIDLSRALTHVGMGLSGSRLELTGVHESLNPAAAGVHEENETHELRAWHKVRDGPWEEIDPGRLADRQPKDFERMVIAFGDLTEEQITQFQEQSSDPAQGADAPPEEKPEKPWLPIMGITIIAIIALVVWSNLQRKM